MTEPIMNLSFHFDLSAPQEVKVPPNGNAIVNTELTPSIAASILRNNGIDPDFTEGATLLRSAITVPVVKFNQQISGADLALHILAQVADDISDYTGIPLEAKPIHQIPIEVCHLLLQHIASDSGLDFDDENWSYSSNPYRGEINPFIHININPFLYLDLSPESRQIIASSA